LNEGGKKEASRQRSPWRLLCSVLQICTVSDSAIGPTLFQKCLVHLGIEQGVSQLRGGLALTCTGPDNWGMRLAGLGILGLLWRAKSQGRRRWASFSV